jgi:hypothetical protein
MLRASLKNLNQIKKFSVKRYGRPYKEVMKETSERYFSNTEKLNLVKEFEPL